MVKTNEQYKEDFDKVAEQYDHITNTYSVSRRLDVFNQWAKGDCLEVGAGTGVISKSLRDKQRVVATDISPAMVERIKKNLGIEAYACDAEKLPFPDESFDTVIAAECIYYLEHPARFIAEAKRVLRPSGQLLISSTTGVGIFYERLRTVLRMLGFSRMYFNDTNRNYMTIRKLRKILEPSFKIKDVRRIILWPFESSDALNRFLEKTFLNQLSIFLVIRAKKP